MDGRRASMTGRGGGGGGAGGGGGGGGGSNTSGPGSLDWVVGLRVRVSTIIDDTYEGIVYAYDPTTYTVALRHTPTNNGNITPSAAPNNSPLADYRILKLSFLKDVQVLSAPPKQTTTGPVAGGPFTNAEPKIAPVNIQNVLDREKMAVKLEAEKSVTRGVGVTKEAQEIFDGLSRMMPCRWQGKTIVVMDMICVTEPYGPDNVKPGVGQQVNLHALQRVKKVVEGERKRIFDAAKKSSTPSTPIPAANSVNSNSTPNSMTPVPAVPVVGERKGG